MRGTGTPLGAWALGAWALATWTGCSVAVQCRVGLPPEGPARHLADDDLVATGNLDDLTCATVVLSGA